VVATAVALGAGKSLFAGLIQRLDPALTNTRAFGNGSVVPGNVSRLPLDWSTVAWIARNPL